MKNLIIGALILLVACSNKSPVAPVQNKCDTVYISGSGTGAPLESAELPCKCDDKDNGFTIAVDSMLFDVSDKTLTGRIKLRFNTFTFYYNFSQFYIQYYFGKPAIMMDVESTDLRYGTEYKVSFYYYKK